MKRIKIILAIISFIVVAFLLTGIIVKETTYTVKVSVNKPVEEVFKTFNTSGNIKNWIPEIKSVEVVNDNPGKVGSIYKMTIDANGEEIITTEKVLDFVENKKVTLFFDAENMLKKDEYLFTENNGITTVTLNASCQSDSYIMACMFPLFKSTFVKQDQSYMDSFKAFVEKH
ncbi:SRPBCC family protein [Polaribacter sargassicola]|uniref:SRPBCC family protein n=1 Tax=Polaribacter sargassicola TaxID=2836891 RepID=UPI001F313742|nr:SRPBCC family protein [Polaribacter sp. DS7-9]MCG1035444.1 SRPBCC family protein [Polaribacter sp. DS7-9]